MRKLIVALAFLFLSFASLHSENFLHRKAVPKTNSVLGIAAFDTNEGSATDLFMFRSAYALASQYVSAMAGFQFTDRTVDFTALGIFWILRYKKHDLGVNALYHLSRLKKISTTNDLFAGLFYKWQPFTWFSVSLNFNYFFKSRTVFALTATNPALVNNTIAFALRTTFSPMQRMSFFLEIASYEFFRYMLFCAPSFIAGTSFDVTKHLDFLFSVKRRYIDFFTLSAGYDNSEFSLAARYTF